MDRAALVLDVSLALGCIGNCEVDSWGDTYFRTGLYKAPQLPFIAGNEASGEVISVGPGVT